MPLKTMILKKSNHFHFDGEESDGNSDQKGTVGRFLVGQFLFKQLMQEWDFLPDFF